LTATGTFKAASRDAILANSSTRATRLALRSAVLRTLFGVIGRPGLVAFGRYADANSDATRRDDTERKLEL